ncbi:hypothetical protein GGS23DRAFT_301519 [Durotheca rogersii]|uniref:uncharacterized protein n=1 Tax=Durotheca rogersii TaxID=419775 RepID=UPI00221ED028|nr:uncharacterized protein GGS23DRAFT_301519 [Durotheca rogersii]KAI5867032.1 hypothetical protein GGS23DRAFT_301519 [Durotheca rogersii]
MGGIMGGSGRCRHDKCRNGLEYLTPRPFPTPSAAGSPKLSLSPPTYLGNEDDSLEAQLAGSSRTARSTAWWNTAFVPAPLSSTASVVYCVWCLSYRPLPRANPVGVVFSCLLSELLLLLSLVFGY